MTTTSPERTPPDSDLVARAESGDREAFAAIYHRYSADIYLFARMMTGSTPMAEDVTQEVFLSFIRDLTRHSVNRRALRTYLYAIARDVSRHSLRKECKPTLLGLSTINEPEIVDDPLADILKSQTITRLRRFIRGLSPRYREVLIMCDLRDFSYEQVSVVLDIPVGTVRSRLHRARRHLADRLMQVGTRKAARKRATCLM